MELPLAGREYAKWTVAAGLPASPTIEIQFPPSTDWHAMEVDGEEIRILVAGPDAPAGGGVVLPAGRTDPIIRLTDTPEIVIRESSAIYVQ